MPNDQEQRLPQIVGERLLVIADYQRPYAWGRKQLADLWEDIDLIGHQGTHYAGTLVLREVEKDGAKETEQSDDGAVLQVCEVVDGQQRLTTCFILLDRIRRRLDELDSRGIRSAGPMARRLRDSYGTVEIDRSERTRLRLGEQLQHYWQHTVLGEERYVGEAPIAGQRRLAEAVSFFDGKLDDLAHGVDDEGFLDRLRDLQGRITARLGFLVYEVKSYAEVGVIFETLNERGRPLTDLEKTKNYLLYLARTIPDGRSEDLANAINRAWADIFQNLTGQGSGADDQLLRAHWLATQEPELRLWKRIDSLKSRFDRSLYVSDATRIIPGERPQVAQDEAWDQLVADVSDYVDTLRRCSFFLKEMFDPQAEFADFGSRRDEVRRWSAALYRSGVVAIYRPLLFAARLAHHDDGAFYRRLVQACERYSARVFVIERRRANSGEPRLARIAYNLTRGSDPEQVLADVDAVHWRYASDARVAATLHNVTENWYVRRGHKYFLYEYEKSEPRAAGELAAFSAFITEAGGEQRTTEHILPQNPGADASCWWDDFTAEQHAELVHSLGNLVLTYDNSVYSNKCFAEKRGRHQEAGEAARSCYVQGRLHQERELAGYPEWTPATIQARQMTLAAWALERWRVEFPPTLVVGEPELESEGSTDDEVLLAEANLLES